MTPEEQGKALAEAVLKECQDELAKLSEYLISQGKYPHEYIITTNWQEVVEGIDKGVNVPFKCSAVHKLALNSLINQEEK